VRTIPRRFAPDTLRRLCHRAFAAAGVPDEDARYMAWALVESDLRGIESHGVTRLAQQLHGLESGAFARAGKPYIRSAFGAVVRMHGDNVMGHLAARDAMAHAVELSETHGVGVVTVSDSNPFGPAGLYVGQAADRGKIAFIATNTPPVMPAHGAARRSIGNNPLAWAIPSAQPPNIVLDMACMVAARGRISLAAREGRPIPPGWALDTSGNPTTDPVAALDGLLLPVGGAKGSGLAVINEVLAGVLAGARILREVADGVVTTGRFEQPTGIGHFALALDPAAWMPIEEFRQRVEELRTALHAETPLDPATPVWLPGEPEFRTRERRLREGIPLAESTVLTLLDIDQWDLVVPLTNEEE
jgi:LDH2 family malate/lactate/ureidoglycolate dehydrogenase